MKINSRAVAGILTVSLVITILALPFLFVAPVSAAVPFEDGFETGDFTNWSPVGNTLAGDPPAVTSGEAYHGTYKAVLDEAGQYAQVRFAPIDHGFMRGYVMFKSFPDAGTQTTVLGLYNVDNFRHMSGARVVNDNGTVKWALWYYDSAEYTVISELEKPVLDKWYCVEVESKANTSTEAESRIYIDGNELTDVSQVGKGNEQPITCGYIWSNTTDNTAVTRWYDDIVIDATYIGPAPNQLPNQPSNVSPSDNATGVSLTPTLVSSAFSDNDNLDTHMASQWQVATTPGDYSSPVFDSGTDSLNLDNITLPSLNYSTTYYWRVAHQDNHGRWSNWSAETSFTTGPRVPIWLWVVIGIGAVLAVVALGVMVILVRRRLARH